MKCSVEQVGGAVQLLSRLVGQNCISAYWLGSAVFEQVDLYEHVDRQGWSC